jgi:kinetochore protein Mis12/MTW1
MLSQAGSSSSKSGDEKPQQLQDERLPNFSFLSSTPAAKQMNVGDGTVASHTPLTTNTRFILSQLPALRAMLTQLRPKLTTLPASADDMDRDSKREERRRYIESRTRIHLERTGELSTGNTNGFVKGRKIDSQEAQALEGVMGVLMDDQ